MPRNRQPAKAAKRHKAAQPNLTWLWIILGVGIIATAVFFMFRPAGNNTPTEISVTQAREKYQQGAFILDVRTQEEWDQTHIANSILIPLDQLAGRLNEVPRDRDVVVVCRSGRRSKEGMTLLRAAGYSQVASMTGGLIEWKAAAYPLEGSAP